MYERDRIKKMSTSSLPLPAHMRCAVISTEKPAENAAPIARNQWLPALQLFVYLQILDFVTTLIGFGAGAAEASPFIRMLMHVGPTTGLLASKLIALGLAAACVYTNRGRLIRWINYWYCGLVLWNLLIILSALHVR